MEENNKQEIIDVEPIVSNEKETIEINPDDVIEPKGFKKNVKSFILKNKILWFISNFSFLIIAALYIVFSLTLKGPFGPYNLNGWGFWWILFLVVPLISLITQTIISKKFYNFPIGFFVVVSYLFIGLLTGLWHPFWVLFLLIPIYHYVTFKIYIKRNKDINNGL